MRFSLSYMKEKNLWVHSIGKQKQALAEINNSLKNQQRNLWWDTYTEAERWGAIYIEDYFEGWQGLTNNGEI